MFLGNSSYWVYSNIKVKITEPACISGPEVMALSLHPNTARSHLSHKLAFEMVVPLPPALAVTMVHVLSTDMSTLMVPEVCPSS
jgi:hypothetical protein